jgi:hypothetical protein
MAIFWIRSDGHVENSYAIRAQGYTVVETEMLQVVVFRQTKRRLDGFSSWRNSFFERQTDLATKTWGAQYCYFVRVDKGGSR